MFGRAAESHSVWRGCACEASPFAKSSLQLTTGMDAALATGGGEGEGEEGRADLHVPVTLIFTARWPTLQSVLAARSRLQESVAECEGSVGTRKHCWRGGQSGQHRTRAGTRTGGDVVKVSLNCTGNVRAPFAVKLVAGTCKNKQYRQSSSVTETARDSVAAATQG